MQPLHGLCRSALFCCAVAWSVIGRATAYLRRQTCDVCPDQGCQGACTRPAPTREAGRGRRRAEACSLLQRFIPRKEGLLWAQRAAQPATWGVAILVPLMVL